MSLAVDKDEAPDLARVRLLQAQDHAQPTFARPHLVEKLWQIANVFAYRHAAGTGRFHGPAPLRRVPQDEAAGLHPTKRPNAGIRVGFFLPAASGTLRYAVGLHGYLKPNSSRPQENPLATLLSILAIGVGPVCGGLVLLLIVRKSAPDKFKSWVRATIAMTLTMVLSRVAEIEFSIYSELASIAIWMAIALTIGTGLALVSASTKSNSTNA